MGWWEGRKEEERRMEREKGRHTAQTSIVAVNSAVAVEVLLSLLGDLGDVGVLVFGGHVDMYVLFDVVWVT